MLVAALAALAANLLLASAFGVREAHACLCNFAGTTLEERL